MNIYTLSSEIYSALPDGYDTTVTHNTMFHMKHTHTRPDTKTKPHTPHTQHTQHHTHRDTYGTASTTTPTGTRAL